MGQAVNFNVGYYGINIEYPFINDGQGNIFQVQEYPQRNCIFDRYF